MAALVLRIGHAPLQRQSADTIPLHRTNVVDRTTEGREAVTF
jgi:hypothetical protein